MQASKVKAYQLEARHHACSVASLFLALCERWQLSQVQLGQ